MRAPLAVALLLVAACAPTDPPGLPPADGDLVARRVRFALTDDSDFERKAPPRPGEWLDRFEEERQTVEEYVRSSPVRADAARGTLAFVRFGAFTAEEAATAEAAVRFASLWFRRPVRELAAEDLPDERWSRDREFPGREGKVRQYRTAFFLADRLPPLLPDDAVVLTALTMGDLYPDEDWNFVFGQSSLRRRVAVSSFARYFAAFRGRPETRESRERALRRAIGVTVHEIGHAFSLPHCVEYECLMNGSNSLEESDRQPLRLCPPCLSKLRYATGFDVLDRYRGLESFYLEHRMTEEAGWVASRRARIERVR